MQVFLWPDHFHHDPCGRVDELDQPHAIQDGVVGGQLEQSICVFESALILDLCGEWFTTLGRNLILRRIAGDYFRLSDWDENGGDDD